MTKLSTTFAMNLFILQSIVRIGCQPLHGWVDTHSKTSGNIQMQLHSNYIQKELRDQAFDNFIAIFAFHRKVMQFLVK